MTTTSLVEAYLEALEHADLEGVLRLFADGAVVHSPLYGELTAREFYPALFLDTASSRLRLRSTMTGGHDGARVVAFWFDFDWTLANGTQHRSPSSTSPSSTATARSQRCGSSTTPPRSARSSPNSVFRKKVPLRDAAQGRT